MTDRVKEVDFLLRKYVGVGLGVAFLVPVLLAIAAASFGLAFPKFEATALLQFPEAQKSAEKASDPRQSEPRSLDRKSWIPKRT